MQLSPECTDVPTLGATSAVNPTFFFFFFLGGGGIITVLLASAISRQLAPNRCNLGGGSIWGHCRATHPLATREGADCMDWVLHPDHSPPPPPLPPSPPPLSAGSLGSGVGLHALAIQGSVVVISGNHTATHTGQWKSFLRLLSTRAVSVTRALAKRSQTRVDITETCAGWLVT